ncbi:MAG: acylphosphatase [Rhodopseudomonas sp.]|nr:acylphosphatase [Rhodopseudomonas sp.]
MSEVIVHVIARGRVQGVGYRAFVEREALKRGLEGWVRNRRDGTVEAVFKGEPDKVEDMIDACQRGPFTAQVEGINRRDGVAADLKSRLPGQSFSVLATL